MSPADKYRDELINAIYFSHLFEEDDTVEHAVLCEELDRVKGTK